MLDRLRPRLTYANVIATVALFVALGGGAYAATELPANSVGTKQLKPGAVTNPKLAKAAVTGSKVAAKSLTGTQIKAGTLGTVPNATNATKLGGQPASSFVQGGGRVFSAHKIVTSSTKTPVAFIPGVGTLNATYSGGTVTFFLTNGSGQTIDRTFADSGGLSDGQPIDANTELLDFGSNINRMLNVQLAWGTGFSAHFVDLRISWFLPGSDAHVLVQGIAR